MSLSKVEIRKGLSSYYENFARHKLIGRLSEIKGMDIYSYIYFIKELIECGNETIHCMANYVKKETGFYISSDTFEMELNIENKDNTIWCTIATGLVSNLTVLRIPIKNDCSSGYKITLIQCLGTFIEITIDNYFNAICDVIDDLL